MNPTRKTNREWWIPYAVIAPAVLLIVVFGIWGPGYDAQAFIYFQF